MDEQQPLRILTLDGGGLQALATLTTLKQVCKAIAKQNGVARPPAPHELFDVIGGIGTGGWIALLLGRYRLDIATCMAAYMDIARGVEIATNEITSTKRKRLIKLDQDQLINIVEVVLKQYGLNPSLLCSDSEERERVEDGSSRCKHAFAAGVVQRTNQENTVFQLFRSYLVHGSGQHDLLPGPHPARCRTSEAFAASGAAKFFSQPYRVGKTVFFDDAFPQSHPITLMALDEAFGIYGPDIPVSVLLNIGPGIPSERDIQEFEASSISSISRLARKFSWPSRNRGFSLMGMLLANTSREQDPRSPDSFEDAANRTSSGMVLRLESQRRDDIKNRLQKLYGQPGDEKYHHLGPDYSVDKSSLNDVHTLCSQKPLSTEFRLAMQAGAESVVKQHWVGGAA